ncbi:MAG: hypothetical protein AAB573_04450 [Patescibacteria group bacterium]
MGRAERKNEVPVPRSLIHEPYARLVDPEGAPVTVHDVRTKALIQGAANGNIVRWLTGNPEQAIRKFKLREGVTYFLFGGSEGSQVTTVRVVEETDYYKRRDTNGDYAKKKTVKFDQVSTFAEWSRNSRDSVSVALLDPDAPKIVYNGKYKFKFRNYFQSSNDSYRRKGKTTAWVMEDARNHQTAAGNEHYLWLLRYTDDAPTEMKTGLTYFFPNTEHGEAGDVKTLKYENGFFKEGKLGVGERWYPTYRVVLIQP